MRFLKITFATILFLPVHAIAQDTPIEDKSELLAYNWTRKDITLEYLRGFSERVKETTAEGEYVYTDGPDRAGSTALMCFEGKLQAVITMEEVPIKDSIGLAWYGQRTRSVRPDLMINGKPVSGSYWAYQPNTKLAIPRRPKLTRKIYNAAIKGETVEVKMSAKDKVTLILPKPNAAFADFGAECGIGRKAKKTE